jgi:hypothetical protein
VPELVSPTRTHGLVDVLDRVLDKGLVIAGDIKINLANVELLTVQVRLLVCSIDKAEQIGLNWWRSDPRLSLPLSARPADALPADGVEHRLARLERQIELLVARSGGIESTPPAGSVTDTAPSSHRAHHQTAHPHGQQ